MLWDPGQCIKHSLCWTEALAAAKANPYLEYVFIPFSSLKDWFIYFGRGGLFLPLLRSSCVLHKYSVAHVSYHFLLICQFCMMSSRECTSRMFFKMSRLDLFGLYYNGGRTVVALVKTLHGYCHLFQVHANCFALLFWRDGKELLW